MKNLVKKKFDENKFLCFWEFGERDIWRSFLELSRNSTFPTYSFKYPLKKHLNFVLLKQSQKTLQLTQWSQLKLPNFIWSFLVLLPRYYVIAIVYNVTRSLLLIVVNKFINVEEESLLSQRKKYKKYFLLIANCVIRCKIHYFVDFAISTCLLLRK